MGDFITGAVAIQFRFVIGIEWLFGIFGLYILYRLLKHFRKRG